MCLRLPEANVVVDVVDIGENRRCARNEAGGAARNPHSGKVGRELGNEVADTGFVREGGNLCARLDVSWTRAERRCGEGPRMDP